MTREQLEQSIQTNMPTNGVGLIAARNTRQVADDLADYVDTQIGTRLFVTNNATNIGNVDGNGAYSNVDSGRRNWIDISSHGAAISLSGLQIGLDASGRIYSRKEENAEWDIVNQLKNVTETDVNKITYPAFIGYAVIENGPIPASEGHHFDVFTFTSADVDGNGWRSILQIAIDRDSDNRYLRTTYTQLDNNAPWFDTNWTKINFDETRVRELIAEYISELIPLIPNAAEQTATNVLIQHDDGEGNITTLFSIDSVTSTKAGVMTTEDKIKLDSAYQKPAGGIPKTDLDQSVQTSLDKADSAYQKPTTGIAKSDLSTDVQTSLDKADSAYQKPTTGIAKSDLSTDVQTSLDKADSAIQEEDLENYAKTEGYYEKLAVGTADTLSGDTRVDAEFYYRKSGGTESVGTGIAKIKEMRGKSIVWNQLLDNTEPAAVQTGFTVIKTSEPNKYNVTVTNMVTDNVNICRLGDVFVNTLHKYYVGIISDSEFLGIRNSTFGDIMSSNILYVSTGLNPTLRLRAHTGLEAGTYNIRIIVIDLTLMFGEGNEPATVEEFENMFPLDYYDYNAGTVIPFAGQNLVTTGFNQWDEEWESGTLDPTTGVPGGEARTIRSKNYIPALANTSYYVGIRVASDGLFCYDANYNFLGQALKNQNNISTTLSGTKYVKFRTVINYNTYLNNICINISDANKNGTYEPYKKNILPLDPSQWRDTQGNLVFPYGGMHGVGNVYDYAKVDADGYIRKVVRCVEQVDMGNLTRWRTGGSSDTPFVYTEVSNSKDLSTNFISSTLVNVGDMSRYDNKIGVGGYLGVNGQIRVRLESEGTTIQNLGSRLQGVMLIFELATPVEIELATPVYANYLVDKYGTEEITPTNGTTPYTTMANLSIIYAVDVKGALNDLPQNYLSKESTENMLNAMVTAGIIASYTMTYDSTNKRYTFTFVHP